MPERVEGGIMGKLKAVSLAAFALRAYTDKWGYVFGAQGEEYSRELAEQWARSRSPHAGWVLSRAAYFVTACKRWFGHRVADCSGLILTAFRELLDPKYEDQAANTFRARFVARGPISTMPDIPGLAVWRKGHIGVHIGGGVVIEASGYEQGVKRSKVPRDYKGNVRKEWGRLADVDYTEAPVVVPKFALKRLLKYRLVNRVIKIRGTDVKAVQTALKAAGFSPGAIDGVFGKFTQAAVKKFQKARGLKVDGVVGKITTVALGGKWTGK